MISTPMKRLLAYILDGIINILLLVIMSLLACLPAVAFNEDFILRKIEILKSYNSINQVLGTINVIYIMLIMLSIILIQCYFWSKSTSMGKMILKMKVVDKENRAPIGFFKMLLRELIGKQVSGFLCGLGYIWILIDKDNQSWHDKIFNTIVVE